MYSHGETEIRYAFGKLELQWGILDNGQNAWSENGLRVMKILWIVKLFRQKNAEHTKVCTATKIMTTAGAMNSTIQWGASRCGNSSGTSVIHI